MLYNFICPSNTGKILAKWEESRRVHGKLNKLTDCHIIISRNIPICYFKLMLWQSIGSGKKRLVRNRRDC